MKTSDGGRTPADVYDELFVPALFQRWAPVVLDEAHAGDGHRILDVACGTGALALAAADRVGSDGKVVALDPNLEMLAVARRKSGTIEWCEGAAESLPFADGEFDAVVSQFGMMFFNDRTRALREMMRVLRPNGRLAVAVCDSLDHSQGYATLASLLERLFGRPIADAFRAPFILGDPQLLLSICHEANTEDAQVRQHKGLVRFASIAALVSTERACAWTLGGLLDDHQFERLSREAEQALQQFVTADGGIEFEMPALIVTAAAPKAEL